MRRFIGILVVTIMLGVIFSTSANAGVQGHYVPGVEGIKAASLPPPGFYWRVYNAYYSSGTLNDEDGNKAPVGFDLSIWALVNRFIYVSDKKILGADYAFDIIIPLQYTSLDINVVGIDDSRTNLGDICIEPFLLSWHGARYDASLGIGFYAPTGGYNLAEPASPGLDHWTTLITFGETVYFDEAKTWSGSVLGRYEIHGEKDKRKIKPGQDLVLEWGLAKNFNKFYDLGLAGYFTWQLTEDSGAGAGEINPLTGVIDPSILYKDRAYAIGPEFMAFIPAAKMFLSIRSLWEFGVSHRSQGNMTCITMTKMF